MARGAGVGLPIVLLWVVSVVPPATAGSGAEPGLGPPESVPGEILLQAASSLDGCVAGAFGSPGGGRNDAPSQAFALAERLRGLGALDVTPVFRTPAVQGELVSAGPVTTARLLTAIRQRLQRGDGSDPALVAQLAHTYRVRLKPGVARGEVLAALMDDPAVVDASPNRLLRVSGQPDDSYLDPDGDGGWSRGSWGQPHEDLWGLRAIGWDAVWRRQGMLWRDPAGIGGGGAVVAVVDTGIDVLHPDLAANVWRDRDGLPGIDMVDVDLQSFLSQGYQAVPGEDYADVDREADDHHGHGTHVAGIIGAVADNGEGIAGIAWGARVMPVRAGFALAYDDVVYGLLAEDAVAAGIVWAVEHGATVVNMSFGMTSGSASIGAALRTAHDSGVVLVAAAGNGDWDQVDFPASLPDVLAVAALNPTMVKQPYSNWGRGVDLCAPGDDILSLRATGTAMTGLDHVVGERYLRASGTSMAAAFVAGMAALVQTARPELTPAGVRQRLQASTMQVAAGPDDGSRRWPLHLPSAERALVGPQRPHLAVRSVGHPDLVPGPTSDGDGAAEPRETAAFTLELVNLGMAIPGRVSFGLEVDDPRVAIWRPAGPWFSDWLLAGQTSTADLALSVSPGVPHDLPVTLTVSVHGDGVAQRLRVPLVVNGPATVLAVRDEIGPGVDAVNTSPAVAASASGLFAVAWLRSDFATAERSVVLRRFSPCGDQLGSDLVVVKTVDALGAPQIAMADDGSLMVAWTTRATGVSSATAFGRCFDQDGVARGDERRLDAGDVGPVETPRLAATADGAYLATWCEFDGIWHVLARRLAGDTSGDGPPFELVRSGAGSAVSSPAIAAGPDGTAVVTYRLWTGHADAAAIALASTGEPLSPPSVVSEASCGVKLTPAIASDPTGGYWVAWDCAQEFGTPAPLMAAHVDGGGHRDQVPLVLLPAGDAQEPFGHAITVNRAGELATAQAECRGGFVLFGCTIRAVRIDRDGGPVAGPVVVDHRDSLMDPGIAVTGDGIVVVWDETGVFPDGVSGRRDLFSRGDVAPRTATGR